MYVSSHYFWTSFDSTCLQVSALVQETLAIVEAEQRIAEKKGEDEEDRDEYAETMAEWVS